MSLARAWRRQLYGASSVALIVPSAMLAALVVLALGGGFGQVGVLGQIFAGPPAPSVAGGAAAGGGAGGVAPSLPSIPAAALVAGPSRPAARRVGTAPGRGRARVVPVSSRGTGGAIAPVGGVAPIVSGPGRAPVPSRPAPTASAPTGPAPSQPSPQPGPSPQPTPVDRIVNTITPVTQQLPAPAGTAVTQAVQAAGGAADSLLPPGLGSGAPAPAQGPKLP
jgi:hypothetical protein